MEEAGIQHTLVDFFTTMTIKIEMVKLSIMLYVLDYPRIRFFTLIIFRIIILKQVTFSLRNLQLVVLILVVRIEEYFIHL